MVQIAHYMPEDFVEPGSVVEFWDVLKANCPSDMDAFVITLSILG